MNNSVRIVVKGCLFVLFISWLVYGCAPFMNLEPKDKIQQQILYKGSCKHTQTFSSVVLWDDGRIHFNAGAFLWNLAFDGKYTLSGDTVHIEWSEKDQEVLGKRLESGLLITENGLKELGDGKHRHFFRYKWEKQDW